MQKLFVKKEQGFTLIEIMVSISIFTILMVMGIAALLSANTAHRRAEGLRSAVDSLNFIMDDIALARHRCCVYRWLSEGDL